MSSAGAIACARACLAHPTAGSPLQSAHPGSIDPDELARERWKGRDGAVNTSGLCRRILVFATHDDTRMGYAGPVESDEVAAIQGEHCPTGVRREVEDFVIGDRLPRVACFERRENVVAEPRSASTVRRGKFSFA
jgi:hypothetical protein